MAKPVCLGSPVMVSLCRCPVGGGSVGTSAGFGSCPGHQQPRVPPGAHGAPMGLLLPFPAYPGLLEGEGDLPVADTASAGFWVLAVGP